MLTNVRGKITNKFYKRYSLQYPEAIRNLEYDPNFAVRGLHYDIKKGLLLKVDCFMQVQLGCVYRGKGNNENFSFCKNYIFPSFI